MATESYGCFHGCLMLLPSWFAPHTILFQRARGELTGISSHLLPHVRSYPCSSVTLARSYSCPVLPLSGRILVRSYPCPVVPLPGLTPVRSYPVLFLNPCPVLSLVRPSKSCCTSPRGETCAGRNLLPTVHGPSIVLARLQSILGVPGRLRLL